MEADRIQSLLSSEFGRWNLVRTELLEIKEAYADARRTVIAGPSDLALSDFNPEAFIVREKTWVILSKQGRIKRQKGFSDLSAIRVPDGDEVGWVLRSDTTQTLIVCTQFGKAYTVRIDDITATTGYGDPIQSHLQLLRWRTNHRGRFERSKAPPRGEHRYAGPRGG